jgi:hypothetical protein
MEYRQFLKSLVPGKDTLKADTVQSVVCMLPLRIPDILTGSCVHVMISPFGMRGRSSTLEVDPRCKISSRQVGWRDLALQFDNPQGNILLARDADISWAFHDGRIFSGCFRLG